VTNSDGGGKFRTLQFGNIDGFGTATLITGGTQPRMTIAIVNGIAIALGIRLIVMIFNLQEITAWCPDQPIL
jgi:hypothetical protein